jgi:glycosyltransferase involved in cell wall biosynthesis
MNNKMMKTIVVSAVNLRKGGTLTILRDCLNYLSEMNRDKDFRIVALVHKKSLCDYPGIEYIEMPDIINGWGKRLWCEYVTMRKISKHLAPVHLWLSLHDTTPNVIAERRAVYCQTSFPFLKLKRNDWKFDYKIGLFGLFTRLAYRINIKKNDYLIVQAEWLRKGFSKMFGIPQQKFIVAPPPQKNQIELVLNDKPEDCFSFFYAATPDCHKNFEVICEAANWLEQEIGSKRFRVLLTINGKENKYAQWLYQKWGTVKSIVFAGFMSKEILYETYAKADCLIFPSRIETWGLPITEFMSTGKPMLLADLPYAHETAAGSKQTDFFNPESAEELKNKMLQLIQGNTSFLKPVEKNIIAEPLAEDWKTLFDKLMNC